MDLSITFLIAVTIATFFPGKSYNVSYGDSCFSVLEFCHIFFLFYHVWRDTRICDKCFDVIFLIWHFCNKYFVVDYIFCDIICRFSFGLFLLVAILFFVIVNFEIIAFILLIFILVFIFFFFSDYVRTVCIYMFGVVTLMTCWYVLHLLCSRSIFPCAHISRKFCRHPWIGISRRGISHLLLKFLVLIVHSFGQISTKYCHGSSQ